MEKSDLVIDFMWSLKREAKLFGDLQVIPLSQQVDELDSINWKIEVE